jgi:hypothetical protein
MRLWPDFILSTGSNPTSRRNRMKRAFIGALSIVAIMVCGSSLSHAAFVHPGLLNNRAEYDLMPWTSMAEINVLAMQ